MYTIIIYYILFVKIVKDDNKEGSGDVYQNNVINGGYEVSKDNGKFT